MKGELEVHSRSRALSSGWDQFLATGPGPNGQTVYLHLACLPPQVSVQQSVTPSFQVLLFTPRALPGLGGASVPCCSSVLPVLAWAGGGFLHGDLAQGPITLLQAPVVF